MLRGFATVTYWAEDLEAAKEWYSELLGIDPYFELPRYYEFRVGDYGHELGLIDSRYAPATSTLSLRLRSARRPVAPIHRSA
jgi:catechol 2,3-dioxygenase-like lactoylglutathione lyase family enzyme